MKALPIVCVAFLLSSTGAAVAQAQSSEPAARPEHVENGTPITQLIATVQKKTGKRFVVDPQVHGDVELVEKDLASISYSDFLTILQVYGYSAFETGGYIEVLPIANARTIGVPIISGDEKRPDAQIVTKILGAKNIPVAQLVPILRPMIPRYGHFAALPCVNKLIVVDTFANVRRIEAVIQSMDVGEPYKPGPCGGLPAEH